MFGDIFPATTKSNALDFEAKLVNTGGEGRLPSAMIAPLAFPSQRPRIVITC